MPHLDVSIPATAKYYIAKHYIDFMDRENKYGLLSAITVNFKDITYDPEKLSKDHLRLIGRAYFEKYPKDNNFFHKIFVSANDQRIAFALSNCDKNNARACWNFLIQQFATFTNTNSKLSRTIIRVFELAFSYRFNTYEKNMLKAIINDKLPAKDIFPQFQRTVDDFYSDKKLDLVVF